MANLGCEALRSEDGESFLYFAYGSNLLTERIHLRNPSAVFYSVARLQVSALRLAPEMSSALCRQRGKDFENSFSQGRWSSALVWACSSLCSEYIRVPCTNLPQPLPPRVPLALSQPSA